MCPIVWSNIFYKVKSLNYTQNNNEIYYNVTLVNVLKNEFLSCDNDEIVRALSDSRGSVTTVMLLSS